MIQHAAVIAGIACLVVVMERIAKRYYPTFETRSIGRIVLDTTVVYALAIFAQTAVSKEVFDQTSTPVAFTGDPPF